MISQERYNRLDLEIRQLQARLINEREMYTLELQDLRHRLTQVTESRDLARRVAMRLEEENAQLVNVPIWGEAR